MMGDPKRDVTAPLVIPNPDPSEMTRAKIDHDIEELQQKLYERIEGLRMAMQARLDAIDKASLLFETNLNRIPTQTDRQVGGLQDLIYAKLEALQTLLNSNHVLTDEKFNGVDRQFVERDVRVGQSAVAATTAVNAALQAAKEAVGEQNKSFTLSITKSETATMKQIDALLVTSQTATTGLLTTITDVKERLTRIEGQAVGRVDTTSDNNRSNSMAISIAAVIISAVGAIAYVSTFLHSVQVVK